MSQAGPEPSLPGPLIDLRARWRTARVVLAIGALLLLGALWRPLAPSSAPWLRVTVTLVLGLGVAATALLASLKGRGASAQAAFYLFLLLSLDGLGQTLAPQGWPIWPAVTVLIGAVAIAEPLSWALGAAGAAALLVGADAVWAVATPRMAVATAAGYVALAVALNRALAAEKRRLQVAEHEVGRYKHGLDPLDEGGPALSTAALTLRQVSEEGRRTRQRDRAGELYGTLDRLVAAAREAVGAHAVLYFEVDHEREAAYVRAAAGPQTILKDAVVSTRQDPFSFVLDRRQAFYATDFKRLLHDLPWYLGEARLGTLLAVPVWTAEAISGVLVAEKAEIQGFSGQEPALLEAFAALAGDAVVRMRLSLGREEMGVEFKAVYAVSRNLSTLMESTAVRRVLLRAARDLVSVESATVVMTDEAQTRYVVEEADGWAREFEGREVALSERTWAGWVLRSAEEPYLLDHVTSHRDRMPILVLDEPGGAAESLLAVPLKARNRTLGALVLTGKKGAFDAVAHRVLGILANQAAAALSNVQLLERIKEQATRDALTGLYNRRSFNEALAHAIGRESRQKGKFALVIMDVDHFKKVNDTYGHPAGDAVLRSTAQVLERHLRKGDQASRYGGEEFAVILPGSDEAGACQFAERIRKALEAHQIVFEGARLSVTASFGVAVWPLHAEEAAALAAAADRGLYAAKAAGRNRVVPAPALPAPAAAS